MSRANAKTSLAELRALRASGKKRLDTYEVEQEEDLYEEVDEEGYKKVLRDRLNQDDFVIDDNGAGYADDGREDWDRGDVYESESEAEVRGTKSKNTKAAKRKREEEKARRENEGKSISNYFQKGVPSAQPKPKV
jgi:DNA polymerase alpha subunit A